jgi:hypothetical protein
VNPSDTIAMETINGLYTTDECLLLNSTNTTLYIDTVLDVSDISFTIIEHRTISDGKRIEIIPSSNVDVALMSAYIEVSYTEEDIPEEIDESEMLLYLWNPYYEQLEPCLPSGVDTNNDFVWGETEHFSNFRITVMNEIPPYNISDDIRF